MSSKKRRKVRNDFRGFGEKILVIPTHKPIPKSERIIREDGKELFYCTCCNSYYWEDQHWS